MPGSWHPSIPARLSSRWTDNEEITECLSPEFRTSPISCLPPPISGHSRHFPEPLSLRQSNRKTESNQNKRQCQPIHLARSIPDLDSDTSHSICSKSKSLSFSSKLSFLRHQRMALLSPYRVPNHPQSGDQWRLPISLPVSLQWDEIPICLSCPFLILSSHLCGLISGLCISGYLLFALSASSLNLSIYHACLLLGYCPQIVGLNKQSPAWNLSMALQLLLQQFANSL